MALLLSRSDVVSLLTMRDAIDAVEEALRQLHAGAVDMPQRTAIRVPQHHGSALFMPALIGGMSALGMKVVTVYPENPSLHGVPTVLGVILLNDPVTGALASIMDGGYITAMRTGGISGVATRYMALPDADVAGVFGAGVQARTQLEAVAAERPIRRAVVYDVVPEQADRFAVEMSSRLGIDVEPVPDPRQAVTGCRVICTATSAAEPVFRGDWLEPGTHINGIGSHAPGMRELDTETVRRSRLIVDLASAALAEAGDILLPIAEGAIAADHIAGELSAVVAGQLPGRTTSDEVTLFKSEGLAVQDVSVARRVYELALERGVGAHVTI
jgi:ornithine cyclodeaminase/alanine dehydrogenase